MRFVLIFISLLSSSLYAQNLEQKTVLAAQEAFLRFEILKTVSAQCKNNEFMALVDEKALKSEIKSKLKITSERFKQILTEDSVFYVEELAFLDTFECNNQKNDELIEQLYEDYDMAYFNLSIALDLDTPLLSQKEIKVLQAKHFKSALKEAYDKAHSIALGTLVLTEKIPYKFQKQYISSTAKNKYAYHLAQGWKNSAPQFIVADYWSHEWEYKGFKKNTAEKLGIQFLFFIDNRNRIFERVPKKQAHEIIKQLGQYDWQWLGGDLQTK